MAYEMLAGEPPFRGTTAQALIAAHMTRAPPPVTDVRPAVPPALAADRIRAASRNDRPTGSSGRKSCSRRSTRDRHHGYPDRRDADRRHPPRAHLAPASCAGVLRRRRRRAARRRVGAPHLVRSA